MLRICCLHQWYGLSDPGVEGALYDMESIPSGAQVRRFTGLELGEDAISDETTVLNFRYLLEEHNLTSSVIEAVKAYLGEQGLLLSGGSIVDATIIHAPPSTKNKAKQHDPEMSSTKKGNTWHFGMKAHISVDAKSGLVHMVGITPASNHDNSFISELIREDYRAIFGDKGYASDQTKRAARQAHVYWAVWDKAKRNRKHSGSQRKRNKKHASVRAKVEHVFRVVKCQFGYRKTRYKGLIKNAAQVFSLMALANLCHARGALLAIVA